MRVARTFGRALRAGRSDKRVSRSAERRRAKLARLSSRRKKCSGPTPRTGVVIRAGSLQAGVVTSHDPTYRRCLPRISEFYGIVVEMYFADHAPPHFHARYAGDEALI